MIEYHKLRLCKGTISTVRHEAGRLCRHFKVVVKLLPLFGCLGSGNCSQPQNKDTGILMQLARGFDTMPFDASRLSIQACYTTSLCISGLLAWETHVLAESLNDVAGLYVDNSISAQRALTSGV